MTSTPPTTPTPTLRSRLRSRVSDFLWPLVWMAILAGAANVSLRAISTMTQNPPLPDCTQLSRVETDSARLLCARSNVRSGSAQALIEAIELVAPWQSSNPLYEEANLLMNRWSKALLSELDDMVQQGDMQQALSIAVRIPAQLEVYPEVQSAIAHWSQEWETGQAVETKVSKAIAERDWIAARRALQLLKVLNTHYWVRVRYTQLKENIDREETGRKQLNKAQALAKTGDLPKLGEALSIARAINLETAAWEEAKPDLDRWAERVMQYSFKKWEMEDIEAAIAVVQLVPPDLAVTAEAQDLLSFAHAQRLATGKYDQWTPSYGKVYNLLEAIQALKQISPSSPFYNEAQDSLAIWQKKLADMEQLQYAHTLAQIGYKSTYRWAIAEAEEITQERPQRVQAQTLVSHWTKEIQRIEDRPILTAAVRLATAGGKENLQAAIAQASQVEKGRALRIEGQTYIAEWEDRIEIIEDQPILKAAEQLAISGNLTDAIAQAEKVAAGRALHEKAQTAINGWKEDIQIIEDRPILTWAESLAAEGSLTAAIETAAQIAPGRALSDEASVSIAIWERERAYIWSLAESTEDSYDTGYSNDPYNTNSSLDNGDGYSNGY